MSLQPIQSDTSTTTRDEETRTATSADKTAIRPFRVDVPEAELTELRRRINATGGLNKKRSPINRRACSSRRFRSSRATGRPITIGGRCEARLNALPQFITEIDGLDIHFIHVRSKHEDALPLIVTHGWPGSVMEQLKIVDPLTNPTAHGGTHPMLSIW